MEFTKKDVVSYYNQTLVHYQVMWGLKKSKGVHFGIWYPDTKNFHQSINNTNEQIARHVTGGDNYKILDAGCGVGGTSIFLTEKFGCRVTGITISKAQYKLALENVKGSQPEHLVQFDLGDYTNTGYEDNSFDMVFGLESFCHAPNKVDVYKEAFRILKPGGKLVMLDYFKTKKGQEPAHRITLQKWLGCWAISDIDTRKDTMNKLVALGFGEVKYENLTPLIKKTMRNMNRKAYLGSLTSWVYRLFYPGKYLFAQNHHRSGWLVYQVYHEKLFDYELISAVKPG